ncbi:Bcprx2 [Botrytis cinerea B05.10]|uniref:thioredoxin-dependent peroxiredoxin n=3 Tax=Botryotinia fuckeliana TaxID=40559 RepID=A0A384JY47_BOTFB|nr:Bcprx2 [Botrytis cinerea B05.10]ATZ55458.1 Bcprx2 [Botrytis cinerea B05.10]EMR85384.1 putative alkyl hydroperoxide reductase thiol specific antioxidant mal allergen protein [Botrytis cinerea BcDW1]CCD45321.1 similar to alkyl hydroperoxide reductase/ thiol specific antioxidant/ mal allergen [Botrytis cinerea T4]
MSLASQLSSITTQFEANAPTALKNTINKTNTQFQQTFSPSLALQPGRPFPLTTLPNAVGTPISIRTLLLASPLLITFYRGSWCPFCNLALHSLQQHLPLFTAHNIKLVAISPELPDTSLNTVEKHSLEFEVLSDVGNALARELGILFQQPEEMRSVFETFGHDMEKRNGDASLEVPVPATFLVGRDGVVKRRFVDPDWTKRVETSEVLRWVEELEGKGEL